METGRMSSRKKVAVAVCEDGPIEAIGTVTVLEEGFPRGVIDGTYFFKKDIIPTGSEITKGCKVEFTAAISEESLQWEVTSIKPHISQRERERQERRKYVSITGEVVALDEEFARVKYGKDVENDFQQVPVACLPKDFPVRKGDYLKVQLELNNPDDENAGGKVHAVEPTNKRALIGFVQLGNGGLTVDGYIFLDAEVCFNNRLPRTGVCVSVLAIESRQGSLTWRAVSVKPSNFNEFTSAHQESEAWLGAVNSWKESLDEILTDKCGVNILPEKLLGFSGIMVGSFAIRSVEIQNNTTKTVCLHAIIVKGDQSVCRFVVDESFRREGGVMAMIEPNRIRNISITAYPQMLGSTRELVLFDFGDFQIGRYATVTGLTPQVALLDELRIREAGPQHEWKQTRSEGAIKKFMVDAKLPIVRGVKPIRPPFFTHHRLEAHHVPKYFWPIVEKQDQEELVRRVPGVLDELNAENYLSKFQAALWMEEIENDILRRQYDVEDVTIGHTGDHFTFDVPRLWCINPSVVVGDAIFAIDRKDESGIKFEGFIYEIIGTEVRARFDESFVLKCKSGVFTIQFRQSRTSHKRCHFGITHGFKYLGEEFLFPSGEVKCKPARIPYYELDEPSNEDIENLDSQASPAANVKEAGNLFRKRSSTSTEQSTVARIAMTPLRSPSQLLNRRMRSTMSPFRSDTQGPSGAAIRLEWYNRTLNAEQKDAVRRILRGQCRPLPYIVFGPPGTGKTVTIVEAIIQVYKLDKNSRILVVAPSNSAADVIATYLVASGQFSIGDFVRLIGFRRLGITIPDEIRDFCQDGEYLDGIARLRLIICTCTTAGQFFQLGLDTGHFSHVFIDEAGYCTEPEALIGACLVALEKSGQVILAGDPKQLGPVLMSDVASNCGLGVSLLERLMKLPMYSRSEEMFPFDRYNPLVLTKLVKNYRAHPTLLQLPSKLFYDHELQAAASIDVVNLHTTIEVLKHRGIPLLFHGLRGIAAREPNSPSWFNYVEMCEVVSYVKMLRKNGIENGDIGIITPYNKQAEKIRKAIEFELKIDVADLPKVGSVEEFQGQERQVIILSLVRSVRECDPEDTSLEHLEFIFSPKRYNVATTRAKSAMVVIGNPHVLVNDPVWLTLLRYCIELGGYIGCNLPAILEPGLTTPFGASHIWKKFYFKQSDAPLTMLAAASGFSTYPRRKSLNRTVYDSDGEQNLDSDVEDEVD